MNPFQPSNYITMTIENQNEGKLITLSKAFDNRPKVLNAFYFVLFSCMAVPFLYYFDLNSFSDNGFLQTLLIFAMFAAYLVAAYRFINKAIQSEKLLVTPESITLINAGISRTSHTYKNEFISQLRHVDKAVISKHPLAGDSFDYLGFQTNQTMIAELHGDKRVSFLYDGQPVSFGENIYSWDFEELTQIIMEVSGRDFTEKTEEQLITGTPPESEV